MEVLDGKLSMLATFSGLSVSISASLGANVLVSGHLETGITIALGVALAFAAIMLLLATLAAFRGLRPKEYKGITLDVASARVTPRRLRVSPAEAMAKLASTYYTEMLPAARAANGVKLDKVVEAFKYARLGLLGLIIAVVLTAVGSVAWKGDEDGGAGATRGISRVRGATPSEYGGSGQARSGGPDGIHREGSN